MKKGEIEEQKHYKFTIIIHNTHESWAIIVFTTIISPSFLVFFNAKMAWDFSYHQVDWLVGNWVG